MDTAQAIMAQFGEVERSKVVSVLALKVTDPDAFVDQFGHTLKSDPQVGEAIAGAVPLQHTFDFDDQQDFTLKLGHILADNFRPTVHDKEFQIRTHRRGYGWEVPRRLDPGEKDNEMVDELAMWGPALDDCDYVVTIETLHHRAGASLWSYHDFTEHEFLNLP